MTIRSVIFSVLKADPDVSALIGTRTHGLTLPQTPQLPCISAQIIHANRAFMNHGGRNGKAMVSLQVDCYASTLSSAHDLKDKVLNALCPLSGTHFGTKIFYVLSVNETELKDEELQEFRVSLDFDITFKEI